MAAEHFLQDCQTQQTLGAETWPADTAVREELYGPVGTLQHTAAYVPDTGVPVEILQRTAAYVPDTGVPVGILQHTATYVPNTGVPVEILQCTAAYVPDTGVPVGAYHDDEVFALNYKKKSGLTVGSGAV